MPDTLSYKEETLSEKCIFKANVLDSHEKFWYFYLNLSDVQTQKPAEWMHLNSSDTPDFKFSIQMF